MNRHQRQVMLNDALADLQSAMQMMNDGHLEAAKIHQNEATVKALLVIASALAIMCEEQ